MANKRSYRTLDGRLVQGTPKFAPCVDPEHPLFDPIYTHSGFVRFQMTSPLGNAHEWGYFPQRVMDKYRRKWISKILPQWLAWLIRNPLHNWTHFELGIVERVQVDPGQPMPWVHPTDAGWVAYEDEYVRWEKRRHRTKPVRKRRWMKGGIKNKLITCLIGGVQDRGNWRMGTGHSKIDGLVVLVGLAGIAYGLCHVVC